MFPFDSRRQRDDRRPALPSTPSPFSRLSSVQELPICCEMAYQHALRGKLPRPYACTGGELGHTRAVSAQCLQRGGERVGIVRRYEQRCVAPKFARGRNIAEHERATGEPCLEYGEAKWLVTSR